MTKHSLKMLQMTVILTLLLSTVGQALALSPQRQAATLRAVQTVPVAQIQPDSPTAPRPNHLVQLQAPQSRLRTQATQPLAWASSRTTGWTTIITDSFESFPDNWELYAGDLEQTWGATTANADVAYNPDSLNAAWPAAYGADAVDAADGNYPNDLESWMIRGPIDLADWKAAELDFSLNYDIEEGDWLGVCVASFTGMPAPSDFDQDADCSWLYGTTDGWEYDYLDLTSFVGWSDLYIAFVFQSDSSNAEPYAGAFVDELEVWVNDTEVDLTDPENDFVDWAEIASESFDSVALSTDPLWKLDATPAESAWVTSTVLNDDSENPNSTTSVSPTPDYTYSAGERSWMFYGPIDLSNQVEADVFYSAYYDLFYDGDENYDDDDWLAFCPFASDDLLANVSADDVNYDNCDWWSGSSEGDWEQGFYDLTPFAGRSQVYLAWYFEGNNDNAEGGVFIDELFIEGQATTAVVPPPVTFDNSGLELTNGDFAAGLTNWEKQTPSGQTGDVTVSDGKAVVSGNQLLFQNFSVISETVDLNVYFSYAISTTETLSNTDRFCVSLAPAGNPSTLLTDVGCWDAKSVPTFASDGKTFDTFGYSIPHDLLGALRGQTVSLVFELIQNASQPTTLILDDVVAYSLGEASRNPASVTVASTGAVNEVAAPRDANEPNDSNATATALACNQSKAGVFGDVVATSNKDYDIFKLDRVPVGPLIIDMDAVTLQPASSADTLVTLTDVNGTVLGDFDDDGKTLDSLAVYTNTVANATYYVKLYNYNGDGPGAYYTVNVKCAQAAPPPAAPPVTPPSQAAGTNKPWTMILMLNGEDQKCVTANNPAQCWDKATYEAAVRSMESYMGAKQSIMNVVVLLDGPNFGGVASDVTRYVVQPNGAYTLGVNKWILPETNMGDPKTLVDFANWAMTNYPADHYYLAVDDHGGGIDGTSWDHHDVNGKAIDDAITPAELRSALKQITRNGTRKIDIFGYEACLMGLFENVYDLKDYANYITAFQTVSWTALQYPEYFRALTATDTVEQLAKRIVQTYPVTAQAYTFGLIKTSQLETVKTRLDAFANALPAANRSTLMAIRNATQGFRGNPLQGDAASDQTGNIDLWDFAQRVKAAGIAVNEATALQAAIDAAVIQKKAVVKAGTDDYTNYHGLTIIYPDGVYDFLVTYCQDYALSNHGQGGWANFLTTRAYEYTFADYGLSCVGGATVQSASLQQADLRLLRMPRFLEPKPIAEAEVEVQVTTLYLPIVTK